MIFEQDYKWQLDKKVPEFSWLKFNKKYLLVYKRADFKCESCKRNNCRLNVHHIDKNHQNNEMKNLMLVCSKCHLKVHEIEFKKGLEFRLPHISNQRKQLIIELIEQGLSLSEVGKFMGVSKQRVFQIKEKMRL